MYRRFTRQSMPDRLLLIEAIACHVIALVAVKGVPLRIWAPRLGEINHETPEVDVSNYREVAANVTWAVEKTSRLVSWHTTCLMLAIAAMIMLHRRSIPYTLYLGVVTATRADDNMEAHAWLRCGKDILTGASEMDRFSKVTTLGYEIP